MRKYRFTYLKEIELNTHHKEVRKEVCEWLTKLKIVDLDDKSNKEKFDKIDTLSNPLLTYHYVTNFEDILLFTKYVCLAFSFDDFLEESNPEVVKEVAEKFSKIVLEGNYELSQNLRINDFLEAWKDYFDSFKKTREIREIDLKRCNQRFQSWFSGIEKDVTLKSEKRKPTLEEYIDYRMQDVAIPILFNLIEILDNVPDEVIEDSTIQKLCEIVVRHISWVNDLYSIEKDLETNTRNYVTLLMENNNWNEEEAKEFVMKEIENLTVEFKIISQGITDDSVKELYIDRLCDVMVANMKWHEITDRYKMKEHSLEDLRTQETKIIQK